MPTITFTFPLPPSSAPTDAATEPLIRAAFPRLLGALPAPAVDLSGAVDWVQALLSFADFNRLSPADWAAVESAVGPGGADLVDLHSRPADPARPTPLTRTAPTAAQWATLTTAPAFGTGAPATALQAPQTRSWHVPLILPSHPLLTPLPAAIGCLGAASTLPAAYDAQDAAILDRYSTAKSAANGRTQARRQCGRFDPRRAVYQTSSALADVPGERVYETHQALYVFRAPTPIRPRTLPLPAYRLLLRLDARLPGAAHSAHSAHAPQEAPTSSRRGRPPGSLNRRTPEQILTQLQLAYGPFLEDNAIALLARTGALNLPDSPNPLTPLNLLNPTHNHQTFMPLMPDASCLGVPRTALSFVSPLSVLLDILLTDDVPVRRTADAVTVALPVDHLRRITRDNLAAIHEAIDVRCLPTHHEPPNALATHWRKPDPDELIPSLRPGVVINPWYEPFTPRLSG